MIKIGEFSSFAKTTVKTLRYYDEIGLLRAKFVDKNGYRYYEIEQLNQLIKIVELRKLDVSISDIKKILNNNEEQYKVLTNNLLRLENELIRKQNQISLIKNFIEKSKKGEFMEKYIAKEIFVPQNKVYYKHGIIEDMSKLFNFVLKAGEEAKRNNPNLKCLNYCYVTYCANEYREKNIELEYVEAVKEIGKESVNIKFRTDLPIKAIAVQHKGPYENLSKAYAYAINTVKEKGYKIVGQIREVYIDGCWNKENEQDYLTEIQIPISLD